MKSLIYQGNVTHARFGMVKHAFTYPLYMYAFDLDELTELGRSITFFGYNKVRPVAIHDRDYLDERDGSIREKLNRFLETQGCLDGVDRVVLVTSARFFNYIFNPVSFYYCYRKDGSLRCAVAEVNNTFRERHLYILNKPLDPHTKNTHRFRTAKDFHVSPFYGIEGEYEFLMSDLDDSMDIRIHVHKEGQQIFYARMWGLGKAISSTALFGTVVRYPLTAWMTVPRILWQAAKLYYHKKLAVYPKPKPESEMTIRKSMNHEMNTMRLNSVQSNTVSLSWTQKFCRRTVFQFLGKIDRGCLHLIEPNGNTHSFGDTRSDYHHTLRVNNPRFYERAVLGGDVGFGEAYQDGDWSADDLTGLLTLMVENKETLNNFTVKWAWLSRTGNKLRHMLRRNTVEGSRRNIHAHYDIGNPFYQTILDPSMTYSCPIYKHPHESLNQAQMNKLHAIIDKANLSADDHVLEIGTGWGSFAMEAVKRTGCRVTSLTISEEQYHLAKQRIAEAGLQDRIEVMYCDYRKIDGQYDKIVSIEMLEAVGHQYYGTFFSACDRLLKPDGVVVIQAITIPDQRYDDYRQKTDWIQKYIFPGALLPSLTALSQAITKSSRFFIEDLENIGIHYARALREWRERMNAHRNEIEPLGFDGTFFRTWDYYFSYCEAGFATRTLNDIQVVLTRPNNRKLDRTNLPKKD